LTNTADEVVSAPLNIPKQTVYTDGSTVQIGDELVQTTATVSLPKRSLQRSIFDH